MLFVMILYILDVTDKLKAHFLQFGEVTDSVIMFDKITGKHRSV